MIQIKELNAEKLDEFFQYLTIHISENGRDSSSFYFPLSNEQSVLSNELLTKFKDGMNKEFGEDGWRKIWVALNDENKMVGHIDIRSNNQLNSTHRVLLGMGVDIHFGGLGVGQKLLDFVIEYCRTHEKISWLDLEVMDNNTPAKKLYDKMGFQQLAEIKDRFRIDNTPHTYILMTIETEN